MNRCRLRSLLHPKGRPSLVVLPPTAYAPGRGPSVDISVVAARVATEVDISSSDEGSILAAFLLLLSSFLRPLHQLQSFLVCSFSTKTRSKVLEVA
jgi:hypothetical protein